MINQRQNDYHQVKVVQCLSVMGEHGLGIMLTHDIQISHPPSAENIKFSEYFRFNSFIYLTIFTISYPTSLEIFTSSQRNLNISVFEGFPPRGECRWHCQDLIAGTRQFQNRVRDQTAKIILRSLKI